MQQAINDLKKADSIIKKRTRYNCGLLDDDQTEGIKESRARFFFESPDGQNYELLHELQKLGWRSGKYEAPYFWRMSKDGITIEYVEGDVYLTTNSK